jgi:O-antigen/teichoic acid export membrane protein
MVMSKAALALQERLARTPLGPLTQGSARRVRFTRGVVWSLLGSVLAQGVTVVASIVTARLLGKVAFGGLGIINTTIGMLGTFAGLGLGLTTTKYVAELRTADRVRAGRIIGLSMLVAAVSSGVLALALIAFAHSIAERTLHAPELTAALRIGAVLLFFNAMNGMQIGTLSGFEAFRAIARLNLLRGLMTFPLVIAGAKVFGLEGTVAALGAVALCVWWMSERRLRREAARHEVEIHFRGMRGEWPVLWEFSLPGLLAALTVTPVTWFGNALLVRRPGGLAEMGIFNAAHQWRLAIMFVPSVLSQTITPMLANLLGEGDRARFRKLLAANLALVGGITVALAIPVVLLAGKILAAYGGGFSGGTATFTLLVWSAVLLSCAGVVGSAITSSGQMWHGLGLNLVWAIAFVLGARAWIAPHGALGLSEAYFYSYLLHSITSTIYVLIVARSPRFGLGAPNR